MREMMLAIKGIKKALDINDLDSSKLLQASIGCKQTLELSWGSMYEWGIPRSNYGRINIVNMIASIAQKEWTLWCHGDNQTRLNHDSLLSHGINPSTFRIAYTENPMKDLKAAIISPNFKIIIIDSAKGLNDISLAFLHHKAKALRKIIFIIRPYYLSSKRGCIWSKQRFNIVHESFNRPMNIKSVKGNQDFRIEPKYVF